MRFSLTIAISSALLLSGCTSLAGGLGRHDSATSVPAGGGILSQLRPKVDPRFLEKAKQADIDRMNAQAAQMQALQNQAQAQATADGNGRILPKVSMDPIASQEAVAGNIGVPASVENAGAFPAASAATPSTTGVPDMWNGSTMAPTPAPTLVADSRKGGQAATYGSYGGSVPPPPPGSLSGGNLTPPPPAVTLSTQANMQGADPNNPYGNPYANPYVNPYANPYLNPYAVPYQGGYPAMQPSQPERPAGLFGSGQAVPRQAAAEPMQERKRTAFVPITPTGMEARSPYKQRDDLKVLWKGAQSTSALAPFTRDEKLAESLTRLDVGLPADATKGSFSVGQRQIDTIFKPALIDKRIAPVVRRVQSDLVQSYYRYLYTYNKFALAQQTSAARKQEAEVANTDSERQRALADQAQAQNEAESSREDMKSAQLELANAAGPNAARSIIGRVSGITPTADSLAAPEPAQAAVAENKGMFGLPSIGSLFSFGGKKAPEGDGAVAAVPAKMAPMPVDKGNKPGKAEKAEAKQAKAEKVKEAKEAKEPKVAKAEKASAKGADKSGDLAPAPAAVAAKAEAPEPPADPAAGASPVSVKLDSFNISARKTTLSVTVKNSGQGDFSFNADDFSVAENNRKLSDAAMRADFDTTLVQPNQEVKGTITIFGRPWSERLTVSLSDGTRQVQMRR